MLGVVQRGGGLRLAQEAIRVLTGPGQILRQELQGDDSLETGVLGLVDDTHPALAKQVEDAVVGYYAIVHSARGTPILLGAEGAD